jgi:hypothetical protein
VWKLWWCKRKVGAARIGGDDGRRVELTVGANGGGNGGAAALHRVRKDGDDPFIDGRELERRQRIVQSWEGHGMGSGCSGDVHAHCRPVA